MFQPLQPLMKGTDMYLTPLELEAVTLMESRQLVALKIHAPDFLVYNKETKRFCFVEVKSHRSRPTYPQRETFKKFRMVGLPVIVIYPDSRKKNYMSKILKAMNSFTLEKRHVETT